MAVLRTLFIASTYSTFRNPWFEKVLEAGGHKGVILNFWINQISAGQSILPMPGYCTMKFGTTLGQRKRSDE